MDTIAVVIVTMAAAVLSVVVTIWLTLRSERREQSSRRQLEKAEGPAGGAPVVEVSRLTRVTQTQILRCGVVNHPPLTSWTSGPDGFTFGGLYVEIARQAGIEGGFEVEFVPVDWGMLDESFTSLGLDVVLSIFETKVRMEFADFVAPFHKVGVSGVALKGQRKVRAVGDLAKPDVRVSVVVGEVGWEYVTLELEIPKHRTVLVDSSTLNAIFAPVIVGDADIAICDDLTCARFVAANTGYQHVFAKDSLYLCKNAIMVPKGEPDFARWVDRTFTAARAVPHVLALETVALRETDGWVRKFR